MVTYLTSIVFGKEEDCLPLWPEDYGPNKLVGGVSNAESWQPYYFHPLFWAFAQKVTIMMSAGFASSKSILLIQSSWPAWHNMLSTFIYEVYYYRRNEMTLACYSFRFLKKNQPYTCTWSIYKPIPITTEYCVSLWPLVCFHWMVLWSSIGVDFQSIFVEFRNV